MALFAGIVGAFSAAPVWSASPVTFELQVSELEHEGTVAKDIELKLVHLKEHQEVSVDVGGITAPDLPGPLTGIVLHCPGMNMVWPALDCSSGRLEVDESPWGKQQVDLDLDMQALTEGRLAFSGLRYAGGGIKGGFEWSDDVWRLSAEAPGLMLRKIEPVSAMAVDKGIDNLNGRLSLKLGLDGTNTGPRSVSLKGRFSGLGYADQAGEQAAEGIAGEVSFRGKNRAGAWSGTTKLAVQRGELYSDPVFLDFSQQPLKINGRGSWGGKLVRIASMSLDLGKAVEVEGNARLDLSRARLDSGELNASSAHLDQLYSQLLQPWLTDSPLENLEIAGEASFTLKLDAGQPVALDGKLDGLDVEQRDGAFGVVNLAGALHWRKEGESPSSRIGFEAGHLGRLEFGRSDIHATVLDRFAWLAQPVSIPFYGGQIEIGELSWVQTEQGPDVGFDLRIRDTSLEGLSQDLGWPRMQGTINGKVPRARYHDGTLQVAGDLSVGVFDGSLVLSNVRLGEMQSAAPEFQSDMELRRLDLHQLTQTFSFGEIQGRLDGDISGVRLVAWEPDRFDAHFYSSPDDDRRHRISQRAVENLTELGNGVSGALSASFLRFFEEFSYDRIELKVRQRGNQAWIDGIPAPEGGYYLVKGAGLPRIDVIGRNREVGWSDLLNRLKSIRFEDVRMQ